ncbi:hypothetical protein HDU76_001638 [Blyttiomyces sp. JEL0837]|nr:hypothetical protein HDU76_001638 [Blyttiomyces sp. JEL0837]
MPRRRDYSTIHIYLASQHWLKRALNLFLPSLFGTFPPTPSKAISSSKILIQDDNVSAYELVELADRIRGVILGNHLKSPGIMAGDATILRKLAGTLTEPKAAELNNLMLYSRCGWTDLTDQACIVLESLIHSGLQQSDFGLSMESEGYRNSRTRPAGKLDLKFLRKRLDIWVNFGIDEIGRPPPMAVNSQPQRFGFGFWLCVMFPVPLTPSIIDRRRRSRTLAVGGRMSSLSSIDLRAIQSTLPPISPASVLAISSIAGIPLFWTTHTVIVNAEIIAAIFGSRQTSPVVSSTSSFANVPSESQGPESPVSARSRLSEVSGRLSTMSSKIMFDASNEEARNCCAIVAVVVAVLLQGWTTSIGGDTNENVNPARQDNEEDEVTVDSPDIRDDNEGKLAGKEGASMCFSWVEAAKDLESRVLASFGNLTVRDMESLERCLARCMERVIGMKPVDTEAMESLLVLDGTHPLNQQTDETPDASTFSTSHYESELSLGLSRLLAFCLLRDAKIKEGQSSFAASKYTTEQLMSGLGGTTPANGENIRFRTQDLIGREALVCALIGAAAGFRSFPRLTVDSIADSWWVRGRADTLVAMVVGKMDI